MKKTLFLFSILSFILVGCNTGQDSTGYSTIIGDITIVDNGGTNTQSKTNSAEVDVAGNITKSTTENINAKLDEKSK